MAEALPINSGFTVSSGITLARSDARYAFSIPISMSAVQIIPQFSTVDPSLATSAQYGDLARPDGTGLAFVATSGAGPLTSNVFYPPTPFMRLRFSAATTCTVTATLLPVRIP